MGELGASPKERIGLGNLKGVVCKIIEDLRSTVNQLMMADDNKIKSELKDYVYGGGEVGRQADQYAQTTKAIGDYVG